MKRFVFKQAFRLYAIALAVWGAWTLAWLNTAVSMAPGYLGAGWYVLAASGALLAAGLSANRTDVLPITTPAERARTATFAASPLNEPLLGLYGAGLVGWAALTAGWWLSGFAALDAAVVGAGWYAVAAVGVVVLVGLSIAVLEERPELGAAAVQDE